jgi:hypothetical protein
LTEGALGMLHRAAGKDARIEIIERPREPSTSTREDRETDDEARRIAAD